MIRYTIFVTAVLASAATALAAISPKAVVTNPAHATVIYMTEFTQSDAPMVFESCAKEDCSDTPQGI
jgi:hypothetical protein